MVSHDTLARAADFIWTNARLLERRLFAFEFAGGDGAAVVAALRPYQNPDGGFGNALEPDMRCPESQPASTVLALNVLDEADAFDDPMVEGVCAWLASITLPSGGLPWVLPSVEDYPCAPWWRGADHGRARIYPTGAVVGQLLKNGVEHPWLDRAASCCWDIIGAAEPDMLEYHQLVGVAEFLGHASDRARAEAEAQRIGERIRADGLVETVEDKGEYANTPTKWAPTPDSIWRSLFTDDEIATDLDGLAARQQDDGSWPLGFPLTSPAADTEWRGVFTLDALLKLRAYGRLG